VVPLVWLPFRGRSQLLRFHASVVERDVQPSERLRGLVQRCLDVAP
jgi:hypothetical protein